MELCRESGLSKLQVRTWFGNYRKRQWKKDDPKAHKHGFRFGGKISKYQISVQRRKTSKSTTYEPLEITRSLTLEAYSQLDVEKKKYKSLVGQVVAYMQDGNGGGLFTPSPPAE